MCNNKKNSYVFPCNLCVLFCTCICTCTFRAETEVEGAGKLSGQDKALLSAVWIPAVVYALMSDQVDDDNGDKFLNFLSANIQKLSKGSKRSVWQFRRRHLIF